MRSHQVQAAVRGLDLQPSLNDGMQENAIIRFNEQVSSEQAVRVLNGFCYLSVESQS